MHMLKRSLVPPVAYRRPFLTFEDRPDPDNKGKLIRAAIANVTLASGQTAQLEAEDFNRLMDRGFSDQWWFHSNGGRNAYVRTSRRDAPDQMFTIARLIVEGAFGTRVRYQDKDALNLRRANLMVREGYSKGHEAAAMAETTGDEGEF